MTTFTLQTIVTHLVVMFVDDHQRRRMKRLAEQLMSRRDDEGAQRNNEICGLYSESKLLKSQ